MRTSGADAALERQLAAAVAHARGLAGVLDVHAEVDEVHHHLRVRLRLIVAAHHAERHPRLAVLQDHRGHERVQRPLVRANLIGMARHEVEARAAVVQRDAGLAGDDAGAEDAKSDWISEITLP